MKYLIKKNSILTNCYEINTNFIISKNLIELLSCVKGLNLWDLHLPKKYQIEFKVLELFTIEEMTLDINKVIDAYIAVNSQQMFVEDKALIDFAKSKEFYKFLNEYQK